MSKFERLYPDAQTREMDQTRDKHPSIELSDEMIASGWIYRDPQGNYPPLEKLELANKIVEDAYTIDLREKDEKIKSKRSESKTKKIHRKPNKSAIETI